MLRGFLVLAFPLLTAPVLSSSQVRLRGQLSSIGGGGVEGVEEGTEKILQANPFNPITSSSPLASLTSFTSSTPCSSPEVEQIRLKIFTENRAKV